MPSACFCAILSSVYSNCNRKRVDFMLSGILAAIPGATAQGLVWGVMALGVYVTYKLLDIADLTVDSSL